jgi:hypothetical protein
LYTDVRIASRPHKRSYQEQMINDTPNILCIALVTAFATLALAFSVVTWIQGERARHQIISRLRALETQITHLIEETVAITEPTTQSLTSKQARRRTHHGRSNTDLMRRLRPNLSSRSDTDPPYPTPYPIEFHLLPQTHRALRTLIYPPLTIREINQILHDFGASIREIRHSREPIRHVYQPHDTTALDCALIPRIVIAFLAALTRATMEIEPDQLERIVKWLRDVLREMCRDGEDMDSMRITQSSPAPASVSSVTLNRSGDSAVSLSGSTLVQSESSGDEAGRRLVGRHWRPARFGFGGLGEVAGEDAG